MQKFEIWYPIKPFYITQVFGENLNSFYKSLGLDGHNGWDMVGKDGQIIRAAHDGIVTFIGEDGSGGLGIVIRTEQEFLDVYGAPSYWKSIYWHIQKNSFFVKPGQRVKCGDILAKCDNTGKTTGSHLHFGIKPIAKGELDWQWWNLQQNNGYNGAVDPKPYWVGACAEDKQTIFSIAKQSISLAEKILELVRLYKRSGYIK